LLTKGKTGTIKGFKSKNGKSFDAALKFDENYKTVFDFSDKKEKK
jgi:DNA topoisomerase-3